MRSIRSASMMLAAALSFSAVRSAAADAEDDDKLAQAAKVLHEFTANEEQGIPADLLQNARGIAVIPNLIRGGFFIGGRRGRGVLTARTKTGDWSNPAFITLTGGSIGFQFGAEATDIVLVFANDRSVRNIADGKFTLGGDASAVAGPLGRRSTAAVTGKAEVYIYTLHARGAFAGAAVEGARLDIDQNGSAAFYGAQARAFESPNSATPASARQFLAVLGTAADVTTTPSSGPPVRPAEPAQSEEAITFPLDPPH
jgi:lipid-binding SYLF domain-containing protein